ncbi:MAG: transposase [Syntrophobacteraceae bacterium]|nr:transposase [Syntrophobacteraceae bacterium]
MPGARRHFLTGYAWHITHRCHKKEFLLKFAKDRREWVHWLFEAGKRYGFCVLNYVATSNHVHLLVLDREDREAISRSMQLIAGRTAREFNQRKKRKGAFWEDRYHATAVETSHHLFSCLTYIDLNMVRAGAVTHPCEWKFGGYAEMIKDRERSLITDFDVLMELSGAESNEAMLRMRSGWIEDALDRGVQDRQSKWTESVAVGDKDFVEDVKAKLGLRARGRRISGGKNDFTLRETQEAFGGGFDK